MPIPSNSLLTFKIRKPLTPERLPKKIGIEDQRVWQQLYDGLAASKQRVVSAHTTARQKVKDLFKRASAI